jgi:MFS family permease
MKSFALSLIFVALTFLCWGLYGPVLHLGQHAMVDANHQYSSLRPFVCVGIAYFVIAVVAPLAVLFTRGEKGHWTFAGAAWSLGSGIAGAVGALGIILAFKFGGSPVYVMPLVFGGAPVVNTLVNAMMTRSFRESGPMFYAAILLVAVGAAGVMFFKPTVNQDPRVTVDDDGEIRIRKAVEGSGRSEETDIRYEDLDSLRANADDWAVYQTYIAKEKAKPKMSGTQFALVLLSIALTALCWGAYGPVLHKGQSFMAGSRLRPLLCVGLAYFAIAVVPPVIYLQMVGEQGAWTFPGTVWSLAAGAAGAIGALGIILAFTFGGKPIFVMPLVFGMAPVVNTFATLVPAYLRGDRPELNVLFFASLALVVAGAVAVLWFAPRPPKPHGPGGGDKPQPDDRDLPKGEERMSGRDRFERAMGESR